MAKSSVLSRSLAPIVSVCAVWFCIPLNATLANDSSAELATGGLVITKSDDIEMQSDDLFISMKEVRVQYRFFNHSDHDITTQIAFPMPDIPYGADDFNYVIPTNDPENILDFTTLVNNRPIATLVERKAFHNGKDETEVLRNLDVPLAPKFDQKYDYLSQEVWDRLIHLGLIQDTPEDQGLNPLWTLKTTYYWQQTFPAHQEVFIDHRYLPSVGSVVQQSASDLLNHPENLEIDQSKRLNRFCIDQAFLNSMVRTSNPTWEQHILEYVLTTGANWSGPIRNFRLVVDKGSPDNLVSFCGQGVHKISSTQFEIRVTNFTPTSNLSILILTPAKPEGVDVRDATNPPNVSPNIFALNCDQLWYQRNSIFKAAGYCFSTPRGIRSFGNAGCTYDDERSVPLSDHDRQAINALRQLERAKHCP
jgi:hypothetical protein